MSRSAQNKFSPEFYSYLPMVRDLQPIHGSFIDTAPTIIHTTFFSRTHHLF